MERDFLTVAFTLPYFFKGEAEKINRICSGDLIDLLHVRKPEADKNQIRNLMSELSEEILAKARLHSCFDLMSEFSINGVHLNSRNPVAPSVCRNVSKSCHRIDELEDVSSYDYVTLSPIYDSISKSGYSSAFNPKDLKNALAGKRVIALGGVKPCFFPELRECGFVGGAMLGYIWNTPEDLLMYDLEKYKLRTMADIG